MPDWKQYVATRLPALGLRPERECQIVEELAAQLESTWQEARAAGAGEQEALERAASQIPDWQALARDLRDAEAAPYLDPAPAPPGFAGFWNDIRFASRLMVRAPGFSATAVVTIALAVGACTAIYSVLEAVVLRSLDYKNPNELVMVWETNLPRGRTENVISPANFLDWKARNHVFAGMSFLGQTRRSLLDAGDPTELTVQFVNAGFLDVIGTQPILGRGFRADDEHPDQHTVLLAHPLWQSRFQGDPRIIGRTINLSGTLYTVAGVLPANFRSVGTPPDILECASLDPANDYRKRSGRYMRAVARLLPGISIERAQQEMSAIAARLEVEYPEFDKGWGVNLVPLRLQFSGSVRSSLLILMGATFLVLLIACANVAGLLLARAAARAREMAIRASLGAPRSRVIRQLLTESLLLAGAGGVLGCFLAFGALQAIRDFAPRDVPRLDTAALNPAVLLFALALTVGTGILFGLVPALAAVRGSTTRGLKEGGRGLAGGRHGNRLRGAFVIAETALALVLLVGAGLLLRTLSFLAAQPPGFDSSNLLTLGVSLPGRPDDARVVAFFRELNDRIRQVPGVEAASSIVWPPFSGPGAATGFWVDGRPKPPAGEVPVTDVRIVQTGYFETLRIPLQRGRLFREEDQTGKGVCRFIVSEALVRAMFPQEDPLGKRLHVEMGGRKVPGEIIGVVGDVKFDSLSQSARPMVYYPHAELPASSMTLVVRTRSDPHLLTQSLLAVIRQMDPRQPVSDIRTMEDWIGRSLAETRFQTALLSLFAAVALVLAVIGIYGLMAYSVSQRTQEIGIRLTLGALPRDVILGLLRRGMLLASLGVLVGLTGALAVSRVLNKQLYGVTAADPLTYAFVAVILLTVALMAVYFPARRAARFDTLAALRYE